MMKKLAICLLALASAGAMFSCDDDDAKVSAQVQQAFSEMFPSVTRVEWERRGSYLIADFRYDGCDAEAWFDASGAWYMTETEISYPMLPAAVQDAFRAGEYAAWKIEDIEKIERRGMETLYLIEAEYGAAEYDLYYRETGELWRTVPDTAGHRRHDDLLAEVTMP